MALHLLYLLDRGFQWLRTPPVEWTRKSYQTKSGQRGISLVELLVVLGIISLVAALSVMAILRSRSAATQLSCKDKLRQIGLATVHFTDSRNMFPYSKTNSERYGMVGLLPYMEQQVVYDKFIEIPTDRRGEIAAPAFFNCSADPESAPYMNYIPCGGVTSVSGFSNKTSKNIGFYHPGNRSFSQVTDGMSNTVFYSERLTHGWSWPSDFNEAILRYPIIVRDFVQTWEEFDQVCWANRKSGDVNFVAGHTPLATLQAQYPFGTRYTPNTASCQFATNGLYPPDSDELAEAESFTVSSNHGGFVNACFGDASVHAISNEIDRSVWIGAGTIAGHEAQVEW